MGHYSTAARLRPSVLSPTNRISVGGRGRLLFRTKGEILCDLFRLLWVDREGGREGVSPFLGSIVFSLFPMAKG